MAYQYRKTITIDYTKCGTANSTDFPVLISHTDANLKSVGYGGHVSHPLGYDINFYSDSGLTTALSYEVETYNPSTGQIIAWVKVPTLSATVNTVIYIGYGDPLINTFQSTSTSVWSNGFGGVWHLPNGTTLGALDSTSNANNGTLVNTPTATTGQIDGGGNFVSASSQYITAPSTSSLNPGTSPFTISAWVKRASINTLAVIVGKKNLTDNNGLYNLQINNTNTATFLMRGTGLPYRDCQTVATYTSTSDWYYLVGVRASSTSMILYVNGVSAATLNPSELTNVSSVNNFAIANNSAISPSNGWNGVIDEVRVSNSVARSSSWVLAEYNNQSSPSTFYNLSSEVAIYNLNYKRAITIDYTKCGTADSTDFPVLVSFTDVNFKSVANGGKVQNANGYDIKFYSDAGLTNQLFWEIEKYVPTTGECIFWVKVPTLSASANTIIYVSYGDNTITTFQSTSTSVWSNNFQGVYHLTNGTTLNLADSTSLGNNGTNNGATATTGQIDGCANFVLASSQYINTGISSITGTAGMTASAWINTTSLNTTQPQQIIAKWGLSSKTFQLRINELNANTFTFGISDGTTSNGTSITATGAVANTWQYVVGVFDNPNDLMTLYLNGVSIGTATYTGSFGGTEFLAIGRMNYASGNFWYFGGKIDEPRIAYTPRSSSWVLSEYNNQSSPSTFFTLGAETQTSTSNFFQMFY